MAKNLDESIDTAIVSHELVAKFAIAEELRLIASKIDRLFAEFNTAIASTNSNEKQLRNQLSALQQATNELNKSRRILNKEISCQKKKDTNTKSQKKICTGLLITPNSKPNLFNKLKKFFSG